MKRSRGFRVTLLMWLIFAFSTPAWAWGPHTEITAAVLAVLPDREKLRRYFGPDWDRIAKDYCWMGDWREAVRPDHYADDYLLFPASPAHVSHMLPVVRQTYGPFFRRALQAVRTESPQNAARWIGSLLHFVQDSGSPPHTTGIGGELHGKMERWVDEKLVSIAGYEPQLLGKIDADAERGFQARMEGLIEFSRTRAEQLKPILEKLTTRENQPLELESALETARVSADLLHTLCTLGLAESTVAGCRLEGAIELPAVADRDARPPTPALPAKVMLRNTLYSTTCDAAGRFAFRNLPRGKYEVLFLATGYKLTTVANVELRSATPVQLSPRLEPDPVPGNLIRNSEFRLSWIKPGQPDWWSREPQKPNRWASALVRVPLDRKFTIRVAFVDDKPVSVSARWRSNPSSTAGSREVPVNFARQDSVGRRTAEIKPPEGQPPFNANDRVLYLELLIDSDKPIESVCLHVAVTF